jgi:hypothetical protein
LCDSTLVSFFLSEVPAMMMVQAMTVNNMDLEKEIAKISEWKKII